MKLMKQTSDTKKMSRLIDKGKIVQISFLAELIFTLFFQ